MPRVMGSEVEYGIIVSGQPMANPMVASSHVVNSYAAEHGLTRRPRWDFEEESPLRDARGFDLSRDAADPSQLTDEDMGLANIILTNGARLYVDHAHPEYSSPEVTNAFDALRWEKAGEIVMARGAQLAHQVYNQPEIVLYKNNVDNKGASYGAHENYLMSRGIKFNTIIDQLIPFFVTRQIFTGSGRVGRGQEGRDSGFQISQRADYFEVEVGLETTLKRPIINTRDEPHADPEIYRRLHVIIGDANMSETAIWLKMGTTALVLDMIEANALPAAWEFVNSVQTLHRVSYDYEFSGRFALTDGRHVSVFDVQERYLEAAQVFVAKHGDRQDQLIVEHWERVLTGLKNDPMSLANELDWIAKLSLLNQYRERDHIDWDDAKLHLIDLQYHDIRPHKGLYHKLLAAGRMKRLLDPELIQAAVTEPPHNTRAYFRGKCLANFSEHIAAASWDSIIFDLPGAESLQRVPIMEPLRGTKEHVGQLFEDANTATDLFNAIVKGS